MEDPGHLAKLKSGNIGVALGKRSGGLYTIDVDCDEGVDLLLAKNPVLNSTLRTLGLDPLQVGEALMHSGREESTDVFHPMFENFSVRTPNRYPTEGTGVPW